MLLFLDVTIAVLHGLQRLLDSMRPKDSRRSFMDIHESIAAEAAREAADYSSPNRSAQATDEDQPVGECIDPAVFKNQL